MSSSSPPSTLLLVAGTAITASLATLALQRLYQERTSSSSSSTNKKNRRAPKRCAGAIKLQKDQFDRYTQLHDHVWEEVLDRMYDSNIRNFTIYYHEETSTMFHHFDWIGGMDLEHEDAAEIERRFQDDMNAVAADEATREWWGYCEPCQEPFRQWPADLKPHSQQPKSVPPKGDWWAPLVCLNHCGYWPVEYSDQKRDPHFVPQNPEKETSSRSNPPEDSI
ncbi:DUF718 domain protein [Seminavis robusta]|uniref:DUF718 domain protein n=1 Tax=Seminavis robusta TaxID=568900 RepID=A0A9N8F4L5_9STRA|nr:DUF718 domain protein [Seminavis robusta]|eukprot:Sro3958_g352190.1 DUF718 domain protein (222) ;mRNA; f:2162-2827